MTHVYRDETRLAWLPKAIYLGIFLALVAPFNALSDPLYYPPGFQRMPLVGTIDGVRIAIPPDYEISARRFHKLPQSSEINEIVLFLRYGSFSPITTQADWEDFRLHGGMALSAPYAGPPWMQFSIKPASSVFNRGSTPSLAATFDKFKEDNSDLGVDCEAGSIGLEHCKATRVQSAHVNEVYFDDVNGTTLISCAQLLHGFRSCFHEFEFRPMKAVVFTSYMNAEQMEHWKENEVGIKALLSQFLDTSAAN